MNFKWLASFFCMVDISSSFIFAKTPSIFSRSCLKVSFTLFIAFSSSLLSSSSCLKSSSSFYNNSSKMLAVLLTVSKQTRLQNLIQLYTGFLYSNKNKLFLRPFNKSLFLSLVLVVQYTSKFPNSLFLYEYTTGSYTWYLTIIHRSGGE